MQTPRSTLTLVYSTDLIPLALTIEENCNFLLISYLPHLCSQREYLYNI